MKQKKKIAINEEIPIKLTINDRNLLIDNSFIDDEQIELLQSATEQRGMITIHLTLDDLDDLLGYIAFHANHADDSKLEAAFDEMYDRLSEIESMYEIIDD
jgi:NTP pyrophosphatase (non-canonical NTP hydrolase)